MIKARSQYNFLSPHWARAKNKAISTKSRNRKIHILVRYVSKDLTNKLLQEMWHALFHRTSYYFYYTLLLITHFKTCVYVYVKVGTASFVPNNYAASKEAGMAGSSMLRAAAAITALAQCQQDPKYTKPHKYPSIPAIDLLSSMRPSGSPGLSTNFH